MAYNSTVNDTCCDLCGPTEDEVLKSLISLEEGNVTESVLAGQLKYIFSITGQELIMPVSSSSIQLSSAKRYYPQHNNLVSSYWHNKQVNRYSVIDIISYYGNRKGLYFRHKIQLFCSKGQDLMTRPTLLLQSSHLDYYIECIV